MATWVTNELVQQWLERTKLTVERVPDELDQTAHDVVFGRVSQVYDVSDWIDVATTPSLILRIMSMLVAAWTYELTYSEDLPLDNNNWGVRLEAMAMGLIQDIVDKVLLLPTATVPTSGLSEPIFFPTDVQEVDGEGSETKFTMGKVF